MRDMASRARTGFVTLVLIACAAFMGVPATAMADAPSWASNNSIYSLSGAVYSIYSSQGDAQSGSNVRATLTTDASGNTGTVELDPGDYWVVETTVPKGMMQDPNYTVANPHKITVKSDDTVTMESTDPAQNWSVDVVKRDNASGATAQGDATLAGGSFLVRAYAGKISSSKNELEGMTPDVNRTVNSTEGTPIKVPLGTVLITETKAPDGMSDGSTSRGNTWVIVQYDGTGEPRIVGDSNGYAVQHSHGNHESFHVELGNWVRSQPIRLQKKDSQTGTTPQADNTLAGARYRVTNRSAAAIYLPTENGKYEKVNVGDTVCEMVTDEQGQAVTPNLPYGTYQITELEAPKYMHLNTRDVTVVVHPGSDQSAEPVYVGTEQSDNVISYPVNFKKQDEDTGDTPQGDTTLQGAEFQITNRSANAIIYDKRTVNPGDVITTLTTGSDGLTSTINLPHGSYELKETKAPKGYQLDDTVKQFSIGDPNQPQDTQKLLTVTVTDKVDHKTNVFAKTVAGMKQLANYDASGAAFEVYNISANPIMYETHGKYGERRFVPVETGTNHVQHQGGWIDTLVSGPDGLTPYTSPLPAGTYGVIETKAPDGVHLYSDTHQRDSRGFDQVFTIDTNGNVSQSPVAFDDFPILTTLTVIKRDTDIGDVSQGDATLDGATFSITNQSKYDLPVYDATGRKVRTVKRGEKICDDVTVHATTKTDADGNTSTVYQAVVPVQIPVRSTVEVKETKAPVGYTLNGATYTVDIGVDGGTQSIEVEGNEPL